MLDRTLSSASWSRRDALAALAGFAAAGLTGRARAQGGPIRLVVGFPAGGSADTTTRLVADQLRIALGRTVIVDNRAGASGRIAVSAVKAAAPDGDTLMLVPHGPMTLFPHIYRSLPFDPFKDFTPIGRVCTFDYALSAGPGTPAKTIAEFLKWAKDKKNAASFGSPGAGTIPHFLGLAMAQKAGLDLLHVAYRGAAPAIIDLIGGSTSAAVLPLADSVEHAKAGKITILATFGEKRSTIEPEVPTLKESGVDLALDGWYGIYAPAGVPAQTVTALNTALQTAVRNASEPLSKLGLEPAATTPGQLAEIQRREFAFWKPLVASSGFKPED